MSIDHFDMPECEHWDTLLAKRSSSPEGFPTRRAICCTPLDCQTLDVNWLDLVRPRRSASSLSVQRLNESTTSLGFSSEQLSYSS